MSEAFETALRAVREKVDASGLEGSYKFEIEGEGSIMVENGTVSAGDGEADVTIRATLDTFRELFEGELDPTSAFMSGRIGIDGDMSAAMKLAQMVG